MASNEVFGSKVLIFSFHDDYRKLAAEAAQDAGWYPNSFDNPVYALEELDETIGALITALPVQSPEFGKRSFEPLITRSNELVIPRAIISAHAWARDFVRSEVADTYVSVNNSTTMAKRLTKWLIDISPER